MRRVHTQDSAAGASITRVLLAVVLLASNPRQVFAGAEPDLPGCVSPISGNLETWEQVDEFTKDLDWDEFPEAGEILARRSDPPGKRALIARWRDQNERCFHYSSLRSFILDLDSLVKWSTFTGLLHDLAPPEAAFERVRHDQLSRSRGVVSVEMPADEEAFTNSGLDLYSRYLAMRGKIPLAALEKVRIEPDWLWGVVGGEPSPDSKSSPGWFDCLLNVQEKQCWSCGMRSTWYLDAIGAFPPVSHASRPQDDEIRVALIDSGVNVDEKELAGRFLTTRQGGLLALNAVNGERSVEDADYHGTKVAGVLAASVDGDCTEGVAPRVRLIPIKVADALGLVTASTFEVALRKVRTLPEEQNVKIVLSAVESGGADCSPDVWLELLLLAKKKVLVVFAAGNSNPDLDRFPAFPASYPLPNSLVVGAGYFSSWLSNGGAESVHLAAPGACITTLTPCGSEVSPPGSSFAAPLVAGAAALALERYPSESPLDARARILGGVASTAGFEKHSCTGGVLHLQSTLEMDLAKLHERVPRACSPSEELVERWSCDLASRPRSQWEALLREVAPEP